MEEAKTRTNGETERLVENIKLSISEIVNDYRHGFLGAKETSEKLRGIRIGLRASMWYTDRRTYIELRDMITSARNTVENMEDKIEKETRRAAIRMRLDMLEGLKLDF